MNILENASRLKEFILNTGADMVGFADASKNVSPNLKHLPTGISIAIRLSDEVIDEIHSGPTRSYLNNYETANRILDEIAFKTANHIQNIGYGAYPIPTEQHNVPSHLLPGFPHRAVAALAGIGWIGKSGLLITNQYGPRIQITTVLTNCPLPLDNSIDTSQCGDCTACITGCPAQAISDPASSRDKLPNGFGSAACDEWIKSKYLNLIGAKICGRCTYLCPIAKKNKS